MCVYILEGRPIDWTDLHFSLVSHTLYPKASESCSESRELVFLSHIKTNHEIKRHLDPLGNAEARQGGCYLKGEEAPSGVTLDLVAIEISEMQ